MVQKRTEIYKGWKSLVLKNSFLSLYILPEFGGRIIQIDLDGYEFLFVNPSLAGKEPDSSGLGKNGAWLNFGGEKIWPAPQGWDTPEQWPGPPDPVLDSGIYTVDESSADEGNNAVLLTSPVDYRTGLQIVKKITLSEIRSEVIVNATFINAGNIVRKWSVWPVIQMNTGNDDQENRYQVICPLNSESIFKNGYKVIHGLVNNPQNTLDDNGNLTVDYKYLVGKVGLDSNSDWVGFCDRETGKVFVAMVKYHPEENYPDNNSVQIWSQGRGMIYSRNKISEYKNDRILNPPYMEIELLSPLKEILPGKSQSFEYRMLTCTIPIGESIKGVNKLGVIAVPLDVKILKDEVSITGKFGVFSDGKIVLRFKDALGGIIESRYSLQSWEATPFKEIDILLNIEKNDPLFDQEIFVSADFFGCDDHFVGEMGKIDFKQTY